MFEQPVGNVEKDRSRMIIIISGIAVFVVIGVIALYHMFSSPPEKIEIGGPGSPEYDSYIEHVKISNISMSTGQRLNLHFGRIRCIVQNTGDRVITGLRLRGVVIGHTDAPYDLPLKDMTPGQLDEFLKTRPEAKLNEKIVTPIPQRISDLPPGQSLDIDLNIEPIPDMAPMDMVIQVVGIKLK
jgi:hypothetical protein